MLAASALSLSQIQGWDVEHLEDAAQRWNSTAQLWEDSFESIHRGSLNPGGTVWEGDAAEAAQERTFADLVKVLGLADVLRGASSTARLGASDLQYAQRNAMAAIEAAQAAGFTVGEDLSVSDPTPMATLLRGGRQAEAEELAADIAWRAEALSTLDAEVATKITTITAPLHTVSFDETPTDDPDNAIHALDHKQSPAPDDPTKGDEHREQSALDGWQYPWDPPPPSDSAPGGGRWEIDHRAYESGPGGGPPLGPVAPPKPWHRDFSDAPVTGGSSGLKDIVAPPPNGWGVQPIATNQEAYKFRLVGEGFNGTPDHIRWIQRDGKWFQAAWVDYNFEAEHITKTQFHNRLAALPSYPKGLDDWKPMDIKDIYGLQVKNPRLSLYLPDPGGGQFDLPAGRPVAVAGR